MKRLAVFQHVPFEGPAAIADWAAANGFQVRIFPLWQKPLFPRPEDFDGLVVMGGPMNVDQHSLYPWLAEEKNRIARFIKRGKPVLGVCLGAQLIARAMGRPVFRNSYKEIGWLPVKWTGEGRKLTGAGETTTVFQWHGDTFSLPFGAARLASSRFCENQAFLLEKRVVGLQFHLESTPASVRKLVENCGRELTHGTAIQLAPAILKEQGHFAPLHKILENLLSRIFC